MNISKSQFKEACNKHLPSLWVKFAYKYFSRNTEEKNMLLNNVIVYFLSAAFILGLLGSILKMPLYLIKIISIIYASVLSILVLYLFSAVILNNIRIGKICKELGISTEEYNNLIDIYGE